MYQILASFDTGKGIGQSPRSLSLLPDRGAA